MIKLNICIRLIADMLLTNVLSVQMQYMYMAYSKLPYNSLGIGIDSVSICKVVEHGKSFLFPQLCYLEQMPPLVSKDSVHSL